MLAKGGRFAALGGPCRGRYCAPFGRSYRAVDPPACGGNGAGEGEW